MNHPILIATLFFVLSMACSKAELAEEVTGVRVELFAQGELKEPGQDDFQPFRVEVGRTPDSLQYIFWQSGVSLGALSLPTLITGAYLDQRPSKWPLVGFQFWSEELPADRLWTGSELETFFAPGTTFAFGEGPGRVDLAVLLPLSPTDDGYDWQPSKSSFLDAPEGTMTITSVEDFEYYMLEDSSILRQGKLLHCTFGGEIGRYDLEADLDDGISGFSTDEVVEVRDGEAVFFLKTN